MKNPINLSSVTCSTSVLDSIVMHRVHFGQAHQDGMAACDSYDDVRSGPVEDTVSLLNKDDRGLSENELVQTQLMCYWIGDADEAEMQFGRSLWGGV